MPRRSRRLSPPRLPLLLFALWLLAAASSSTPQSLASPAGSSASSQEAPASPRGKTVTVGGHSVKVGDEIAPGSFGSVYSATDENGKTVVYKKLNSNSKWGAEEIPATKAAGQYIAHDDKGMVQHKVGTTGMKEYLEDKKKNPGGWVPYSDEIARQLKKQQEKAGYTHNDIKAANIRVDTTKTKKSGAPKFQLVDWGYAKKHERPRPRSRRAANGAGRHQNHERVPAAGVQPRRGRAAPPRPQFVRGGVDACQGERRGRGGQGRRGEKRKTGSRGEKAARCGVFAGQEEEV
ncbi:hypothetical protein DFJ73DRAFT_960397, partial [Zopfochytrium polystomum]